MDNKSNKVDVVAVEIETSKILWIKPNKTEANAEAIIYMAVMRQGVEDRYFTTAPAGRFKVGEKFTHNEE